MRIWHAVRGEGSELGILARTQSTPYQIRTGIVVSAEKGWRRDAGKLPMNRGKSAVYIYTPLILLTGLINWVDACICSRRAMALIPGLPKDCSAKLVHSLSHGTAI